MHTYMYLCHHLGIKLVLSSINIDSIIKHIYVCKESTKPSQYRTTTNYKFVEMYV